MPVELRKRKAPVAPAPAPEKPSKAARGGGGGGAAAAAKAKAKAQAVKPADPAPAVATTSTTAATNGEDSSPAPPAPAATTTTTTTTTASKPSSGGGKPAVGHVLDLDGFGGKIQKNDGEETSLKALVDGSKAGVCIFTYPKANTGGCTKQACLFRDAFDDLTAAGLAVYGLSGDSLKSNTSFKEKQHLPYPLLCDPALGLIGALGLKKAPKSTTRGIFVINKAGKVLALEAGGPDATLDVAKRAVQALASGGGAGGDSAGGSSHKADEKEVGGGASQADGLEGGKEAAGQAADDEEKADVDAGASKDGEEAAANGPNGDAGAEKEDTAGEEKKE